MNLWVFPCVWVSEREKTTEILVFSKHTCECEWKWLWAAVCFVLICMFCSIWSVMEEAQRQFMAVIQELQIFLSTGGAEKLKRRWGAQEGRRCAGMNSEEMRRSWKDKKRRVIMSSKYKCIKDITRCSRQTWLSWLAADLMSGGTKSQFFNQLRSSSLPTWHWFFFSFPLVYISAVVVVDQSIEKWSTNLKARGSIAGFGVYMLKCPWAAPTLIEICTYLTHVDYRERCVACCCERSTRLEKCYINSVQLCCTSAYIVLSHKLFQIEKQRLLSDALMRRPDGSFSDSTSV